jgi:hypothetical protein
MALSIFARVGRAIKRGLGLHMIDAQGVVTLQELHKVIDEIKALKYEVQVLGDDARMGRIHAAEHHDNLFNQVNNAYASILDMQVQVSDIKYKCGEVVDTRTQVYKGEDSISTVIFVLEELKSDIAGVRDVVDGLETDPVGKVAEALAEAARNLEVR